MDLDTKCILFYSREYVYSAIPLCHAFRKRIKSTMTELTATSSMVLLLEGKNMLPFISLKPLIVRGHSVENIYCKINNACPVVIFMKQHERRDGGQYVRSPTKYSCACY